MSEADVTCYQVAEAAGSTMTKVSISARMDAASVMAQGASLIVEDCIVKTSCTGSLAWAEAWAPR